MSKNAIQWICQIGLCTLSVGGAVSIAGDTPPSVSVTQTSEITMEELFAGYDVDGNGLLEESECACTSSKQCDANKDGRVSFEEFSDVIVKYVGSQDDALRIVSQLGGVEKFCAAAKQGQLDHIFDVSVDGVFAQWDRNGSGVLEPAECVCEGSKSADANSDGLVSKEEMIYLAESQFGSVDEFLAVVRKSGGVEAFYDEVATDASTFGAVFARYDQNRNGLLEPSEWVCESSRSADLNRDGRVTKSEMATVAERAFGSLDRFEQYVKSQGGAAKFYARRH
ncbi:MAG: hypothetical protein AAGJ40_19810 [Planctomycetota bacterium]